MRITLTCAVPPESAGWERFTETIDMPAAPRAGDILRYRAWPFLVHAVEWTPEDPGGDAYVVLKAYR